MRELIFYRGADLPPLPTRPEDEPDLDAGFIAGVEAAFAKLPPSRIPKVKRGPSWWDYMEALAYWRRERPEMWKRLCRARIARKYALVLLNRRDEAIQQGALGGISASESLLLFANTDTLTTPEEWEYEGDLENWQESIRRIGFDPDEVLAFVRGEIPEWGDEEEVPFDSPPTQSNLPLERSSEE